MAQKSNSMKSRLLLGSAAALLAVAPLTGAFAQDDDTDGDVIVVRGIKKSIQDSLAVKRDSTSIVEAVSAEDIGKLPDSSIAESLARLPGLTAQRSAGRAKDISVRGLGPDFNTALLNGREQVTAGDNRGVEFDQFPSELLSQAVVYKTPDASLLGQGLGGTVDLRTVRPLDATPTKSVSARYEWNEYGALNAGSDDAGYRITGAWFDKNDAGTFGWALAFATQSSPTQAERWDAWGYPEDNGNLVLGGAKPYVESRDLERDAFMGTLQFEPNEDVTVTLDGFYSKFEDRGLLRGIEFPLYWSSAQLQPNYTVEDGLITQGQFNGVQGVVRNDERSFNADLISLGGNVSWQVSDLWTAELDVSHSSIERDYTDIELYAGTAAGGGNGASDDLGFSITGDGAFTFSPMLDYADPSLMRLTDPQGWGQAGFIKSPSTDDELNAVRLTAEREFVDSWVSSVEFGANYTSRDKTKVSPEAFIDLANPDANGTTAVPAGLLQTGTSLDFIGIPSSLSFDPVAAFNTPGLYTTRPLTNSDVIVKEWEVSEDVTTFYTQVNIATDWGNTPVRGNFGLQYVMTDQSSTGARVAGGENNASFAIYTDGDDYNELLPSLNLSFEIMDSTFIRVGAARTLARARMDQMRASQSVDVARNVSDTTSPTGSVCGFDTNGDAFFNANAYRPPGANSNLCVSTNGGNPQLRPYMANGFDVSFEKYFANGTGNFVIAAFTKTVEDFVDGSASAQIDATATANAIYGANFVATYPNAAIGQASFPTNAGEATINGVEAQANIPFDMFAEALEGFGLSASYSYTDAELTRQDGSPTTDLPGYSETVSNIAAWYDRGGFQARISNRYRSDFLAEVTGFGANRDFRTADSESVIDAQIGYNFESGPLQGLGVVLQGYNLTDERFATYLNGDQRQVKDFQQYGATYLLGVNYNF